MRVRSGVTPLLLLLFTVLLGSTTASAAETPPERVVSIIPLGPVKQEYLERVSQELQARMNVRIRIEPARALPPEAYYAPRRRWRAERILDWLDEGLPEGAWKVVAKTKAALLRRLGDLAVHEFGHTLGFPHCEQKGCVIQVSGPEFGTLLREVPRNPFTRRASPGVTALA